MSSHRHSPPHQPPTVEELEPRILYSADAAAGVITPDNWQGPAEVRLLDGAGDATAPTAQGSAQESRSHELVIVDTRMAGYQGLVDDLVRQGDGTRQIEVLLLDPGRDGVDQISEALQGRQGLSTIHLVGHGTEGVIGLGNGALDLRTLLERADQIGAWGDALSASGDLLIYGCNVAGSPDGQALLDGLSALTGADVAASSDATGHASLGADWDLEYRVGQVDADIAPSQSFRDQWVGTLPVYEQYTDYSKDQQLKSNLERGQTFRHTGGSGTYDVNEIGLVLRRDADAEGQDITVTLRDSWDGHILASSTISSSSLGTGLSFVNFRLPTVALQYGTTYTIRISTSASSGGVYLGYDTTGDYPRGDHLNSNGNPQGGQDLAFKVGYDNDATGLPIITGTPAEDRILTADTHAIADADGLGTFAYQWLRNGVAIAGATGGTYTLGDADVGHTISVRVSYTDGQGWDESLTSAPTAPVASVNDAPSGQPIITGTLTEDRTLTADTHAIADADGLGTFAYQWLRNGVAIAGATGATYTLGDADVGHAISVRVSYTDGQGWGESLTSASTAPVASANDSPSGQPLVVGTPTEDRTLTADTHAIADADGLGTFAYQWLRNGVAIAGATGSTYTLGDADVGHAISVRVTYTDGEGWDESLTSASTAPVASINDAPTGQPFITGNAKEDKVLTAHVGPIADADGLGTFAYQWLRNGIAIAGATGSTYTLGDADVGHAISVRVSYTDGQGWDESLTCASTAPVASVNDAPTGQPLVAGTPAEERALTADTYAIADADGLGTFAYQWLRNGAAITGATGATYILGDADVGHTISVRVTYTDGQGWNESLTSASTGPVVAMTQGSGGDTPIGGESPTTGNPPEKPAQNENPTSNPTTPHPTPGTPSQSAPASTPPASSKPGLLTMDHLPPPAAPVQPPDQWEAQAIAAPRVQAISMLSPQLTKVVFADASNHLSEIDIVGNTADGQYSVRMAALNRDDGIPSRPNRDLEVSIAVADDATPETEARHEAAVRTGQALGITLTAGTVLWSLRVSGLLMGMLATIPAWRQLDLLSILPNPADARSNWGRDDSDEASKDEDSIDDILASPDDGGRP